MNVLISSDPVETINNVSLMLGAYSQVLRDMGKKNQDKTLLALSLSIENSTIALRSAEAAMDKK